jgi:hypothetical protein
MEDPLINIRCGLASIVDGHLPNDLETSSFLSEPFVLMRESGFYCMFNFIRPFEVDKINDCLVFY